MSAIKIFLPIALLLFFINNNTSYAQSECALYSKVLDSVYKRSTLIRYNPKMPKKIDPNNLPKEFFDTPTAILEAPYFIILNESLFPLFEPQGSKAINAVSKYNKVKNIEFVPSKVENLEYCDFSNIPISFQKYKKDRDSVDFNAKATCFYKQKNLKVEKKLFEFSRFLKSSDGNFWVCQLLITEYFNPSKQTMWSIVLHKNKNVWDIERLEIMFVR